MRLNIDSEQAAVRALREAGLKATPQRLAIMRSLVGDETHPTAQELYERLSGEFPSLSVATVYNTLSALTRSNYCRPLELGGPLRFDPNVHAHDHAVCEHCGSIRDVHAVGEAQQGEASHPHGETAELGGFTVQRIERIYRGLCASCAQHPERSSE